MRYRHGHSIVNISLPFRIACALTFYIIVIPIAMLFNVMQHSLRYKHRWRIHGIKRAITVANHTTFMDPVTVAGLFLPHLVFQTLLESTVEVPFLGTFTRLLGGVPVPKGISSYKRLVSAAEKIFKVRRFLHFYPEGECFLYNQKINEFKLGAFKIAAELDIPVLPMVAIFKEGCFKAWSFWGRSLPQKTFMVLEPEYPCKYVKRNENGEIISETVKIFAEAVRRKMQKEIDRNNGSHVFYRGQMERLKGIHDFKKLGGKYQTQ